MAQALKPQVRARIETSALRCFADQGYPGTTMAQIAAGSGTAPANVYRYFASKRALFDAVVPEDLPHRHDRLLDTRVAALSLPPGAGGATAATELLDFWLDHRLAVVVLLDRAEGTPFEAYPGAFVRRLAGHAESLLASSGTRVSPPQREILDLVFDNTRRAIARILRGAQGRDETRALVAAFWSYQIPGLDGLLAHLRAAQAEGEQASEPAQ